MRAFQHRHFHFFLVLVRRVHVIISSTAGARGVHFQQARQTDFARAAVHRGHGGDAVEDNMVGHADVGNERVVTYRKIGGRKLFLICAEK